MIQSPSRTPWK